MPKPGLGSPIIASYGGHSLHEMSHGESFFTLFLKRFGGRGLYILDEPEAALSPTRQLAMLARLHALVEGGSQFIIATHSPLLMAYPNATILALSAAGLDQINYGETEHFRVTRDFLRNPQRALKTLLTDASTTDGEEE